MNSAFCEGSTGQLFWSFRKKSLVLFPVGRSSFNVRQNFLGSPLNLAKFSLKCICFTCFTRFFARFLAILACLKSSAFPDLLACFKIQSLSQSAIIMSFVSQSAFFCLTLNFLTGQISFGLKGIYTPAGIAYIFKFRLTWSLHLLYDTGCLSY